MVTVGSSISSGGSAGAGASSGADERVADGDVVRAGEPDDVAGRDLLDLARSRGRA